MLTVGVMKRLFKPVMAHVNTVNDALTALKAKVGLGASNVRIVAATTGTVVLADANGLIAMNHADANTLALPKDILTVGQYLDVMQYGAGTTSVDPGPDVTINGATANVDVSQRYSTGRLRCVAANTFTWEPGFLTPAG